MFFLPKQSRSHPSLWSQLWVARCAGHGERRQEGSALPTAVSGTTRGRERGTATTTGCHGLQQLVTALTAAAPDHGESRREKGVWKMAQVLVVGAEWPQGGWGFDGAQPGEREGLEGVGTAGGIWSLCVCR